MREDIVNINPTALELELNRREFLVTSIFAAGVFSRYINGN